MAKIKKRGARGNAKNFVTRTQAIKKLQVSLADFRRLCIFKGIYPREPRNKKKANKGSTKPVTFYYTKDIQYLLHEPILNKFREHKTFSKKLNKAISKGEIGDAKRLDSNKPVYKLDHIIRERYPSFLDALRDLDDGLNMIFLFANMPATDRISTKVTEDCKKIVNQWSAYVSNEHRLEKCFISIKGVYYSAKIQGQEIIWLSPFKFPQNIPSDIDFRIMLTFLEFYITLLNFVLFKLYKDANLVYPPKIDAQQSRYFSGLSSYILELRNDKSVAKIDAQDGKSVVAASLDASELKKAEKADIEEAEDAEDAEEENLDEFTTSKPNADVLYQPDQGQNQELLFEKMVFFVGREVSIETLEFVILSYNGKVISELIFDALNEEQQKALLDGLTITHHISDRPVVKNKIPGRTYIQPQWIFDCVNKGELLSVSSYAPGETLPPHLSPWGDAGGYDPENVKKAEAEEEEEDEEEELEVEEKEEEEEEDEEEEAQKELELEMKGVKASEVEKQEKKKSKKRKMTREEKEAEEEKEMKKIMMSNKHKKLYQKATYSNQQKDDRIKKLEAKRRKLSKK